MRMTAGRWLVAIAVVHEAITVVAGTGAMTPERFPPRNVFAEVIAEGLVGAFDATRLTIFWSLVFGATLFVHGIELDRVERERGHLDAATGVRLLVLAGVGAILMPISGFWTVVALGAWIVWRARLRRALAIG